MESDKPILIFVYEYIYIYKFIEKIKQNSKNLKINMLAIPYTLQYIKVKSFTALLLQK